MQRAIGKGPFTKLRLWEKFRTSGDMGLEKNGSMSLCCYMVNFIKNGWSHCISGMPDVKWK